MSFYDDPENVKTYIQLCEGYDGSLLYESLSRFLPADAELLELGSGAGVDIGFLNEQFRVTGSDLSDEFLKICRKTHPAIPFLKLDAVKLDTEQTFDAIYSNKVLHHLTEEELITSLSKQAKRLSPNGIIAHSFWVGSGTEEMEGLLFTLYSPDQLHRLMDEHFDVLFTERYDEMDEGDSIFIIARRKK